MVFGITITFLAALLFVAVVSASRDFEQACLAGLVLAATPFFFEQGPAQMADMPIAYYVLASGSLVYLSLKMKEARLAMVSGFLA